MQCLAQNFSNSTSFMFLGDPLGLKSLGKHAACNKQTNAE